MIGMNPLDEEIFRNQVALNNIQTNVDAAIKEFSKQTDKDTIARMAYEIVELRRQLNDR